MLNANALAIVAAKIWALLVNPNAVHSEFYQDRNRSRIYAEEQGVSDNNPDLVFQEVDEEIRRERLQMLWKAYGKYAVALCIGVVLIVAGNQGYDYLKSEREDANAAIYNAALEASVIDGADSIAIWQQAMPNLGEGYRALAQLRVAAAQTKSGDTDAALNTYDTLIGEAEGDEALTELANLLAAMLIAGEKQDLDTAKGRFASLAVKGRPWYYSALEHMALIDLKQGNDLEALSHFRALAGDIETPANIKARANDFRAMLEDKARVQIDQEPVVPLKEPSLSSETEENQ